MEMRSGLRADWACSMVCLSIAGLVVAWAVPLCSLAHEQRISQYAHRAWLVRDGFFNGSPNAITQTSDGYIWVGTASGLFRFDGSRFEAWFSPDGTKLPAEEVYGLLGARDGSLWIGMKGGLAHLIDHKLFVYPDFHDDVAGLLEDRSGNIWFTRNDAGGALRSPLCQAFPTSIHCLDQSDGVTTKVCCSFNLTQDTEGYLWVQTEGPVLRWKPGHFETYQPKEWAQTKGIETADDLIGMPDGSVLICVTHSGPFGGLQRVSTGHWEPVKAHGFDGSSVNAGIVFRDKSGGIWLGTGDHGIYHIHANEFEKFGLQEGLSGDYVRKFYQDREDGIWVATSGGVDYFRPRKIATFSKREGLFSDIVDTVAAGRDDAVWLGSAGLDVLKNGHINRIRPDPGGPGFLALFEDSFGRVWCGVNNDLFRYDHGSFQRVHRESGGSTHFIVGIAEDSAHDIWAEVSGGSHELIQIHGLQVVKEYPEAVIPSARALAGGPKGVLWLGLRNGDLARFRDGHAEVFASPGGPKSYVYQVLVNPDGTVFATTSAGLVGWKDGASRLLSSKNGLPCNLVIGVEWDNLGSLWLDTGCGLVRVGKEDMNRWWRDNAAIVTPKVLDAFDGAESGGIPNFNPMARTPDGRLWIANRHMLELIDPARLSQNDVIPPVQIEKVVVDRKPYEPNGHLAFPPRLRDLEIDYAGLSFVNPQKVRFRYMLEGRDMAWQDAGVRRQVFYTDLPPGGYRFRVIACNNDGVWNEVGASLAFYVAPAWFQTTWFRVVCAGVFLTLMWGFYQLRLEQLRRQFNGQLEARITERTRIARDLHDTLLQSLHGLMFEFQAARNLFHKRPEQALRALDDALMGTEQAITESQDAIDDLRSTATADDSLEQLVTMTGESLATTPNGDHGSPTFGLAVEGQTRALIPVIRDETYGIARELLRNAFRHAQARRIEVEILYVEDQLRLRVRDDGKGIDPQVLEEGRRPGHWGLPGVRERAQKIGAKLDIWSEAGAGTEVQLSVAASVAYRKTPGGLQFRLFQRTDNDDH